MSQGPATELDVRVALESSVVRLKRLIWLCAITAAVGALMVWLVLPSLSGTLRRIFGIAFGLMCALGLYGVIAGTILFYSRRSDLASLDR